MGKKVLILATHNQGKVQELRQMLGGLPVEVKSLSDFPDAPTIEEDGGTFQENAVKKAETIARFYKLPALADDSGLEVAALDGRPGVLSARFAGPSASDEENNLKLINSIHDVPSGERQAQFHCVLAFAVPGEETWTCEGICKGQIILEPQGTNGFGYDPLFYLPDLQKTMAELSKEQKNQISHRGTAMRQFIKYMEQWIL